MQPGRPLHIHTMAGETWVAKDKASGSILSTITTTDAAEQRVELAVAPPAAKGRTPPSSRFGARRALRVHVLVGPLRAVALGEFSAARGGLGRGDARPWHGSVFGYGADAPPALRHPAQQPLGRHARLHALVVERRQPSQQDDAAQP